MSLTKRMLLTSDMDASNVQRTENKAKTLTGDPHADVALTWHATWQPDPTVPLIGGQPPVERWSDDSQRWFAAVDRWSGSGSGNTWHSNHDVRGTVATGSQISVRGSRRVQYEESIPEASGWTGGMI
ncbi:hypothetical protein Tco_1115819 [Tanacetum coccineum]